METLTVRDIPDDVHRRVGIFAAGQGISLEAAVRELLDEATRATERIGDAVVEFAKKMQVDFPETERDLDNLEPAKFE